MACGRRARHGKGHHHADVTEDSNLGKLGLRRDSGVYEQKAALLWAALASYLPEGTLERARALVVACRLHPRVLAD